MAIAITETLEEFGEVKQESLAANFGRHYVADPQRGYGPAMHKLLPELARIPSRWIDMSRALFNGSGSFGNGSAMRVAPLGAYFADDFETLIEQAEKSAVPTHCHSEGIAGAIAVAVAAALACAHRDTPLSPNNFLGAICEHTPNSAVQDGILRALSLPHDVSVETAVHTLGNGAKVSAQDTVPFSLWAAAYHLENYEAALWTTVSGLGDRDTTCAIVGGIVAMSAADCIPPTWIECREPIPAWFLYPSPNQN